MDTQQHTHELIDLYLTGKLFGQELDKFKIRLKDDPEFLKEVQLQKAIIQSIEDSRHAELKAMLTERTQKRGFVIPFGTRPLAIAATLLSLLAFGLVLKTILPMNSGEMALEEKQEIETPISTQKTEPEQENANPKVQPVEIDTVSKELVVADNPPVEITEEIEMDADVPVDEIDEEYFNVDDKDIDFSELKKDEDQIDGSAVKAQRDTMLGSKSIPMWALVEMPQPEIEDEGAENMDVMDDDTRDVRKVKEQSTTASKKTLSSTTVKTREQQGSVRIEYWHSIVNFKGYKFDGSKLLLFDTPQDLPLSIVKLNNTVYLKKGSAFYTIVANSSFNRLSKVTDPDLLTILNK